MCQECAAAPEILLEKLLTKQGETTVTRKMGGGQRLADVSNFVTSNGWRIEGYFNHWVAKAVIAISPYIAVLAVIELTGELREIVRSYVSSDFQARVTRFLIGESFNSI